MDLHRRVETGDRDGRLLVLGAVRRASLAIWGKVETVVCVLSPPGGLEQNCPEKVLSDRTTCIPSYQSFCGRRFAWCSPRSETKTQRPERHFKDFFFPLKEYVMKPNLALNLLCS